MQILAPLGGSQVVLRGIDGEADRFVIGASQAAGVPFVENVNPAEGDGILVFVGDLLAARRATWLADPDRRAAALAALRASLGADVVAGLARGVLADLIDNRIELDLPLPAFAPSQINTYGGIVFDVLGRRPLAFVSDYSAATGDQAWSTMSTSVAAGVFSFGDLRLSTSSLAENTRSGATVGEFAAEIPGQHAAIIELVSGAGSDDNDLFEIIRDESGRFPRSILVARGPFDYETNPRLSIRVRSTGEAGTGFEKVFPIRVLNAKEAPSITIPDRFRFREDTAAPLVFPTAPFGTFDAPAATRVTVTLRVARGQLGAVSGMGVTVGGTATARTFTGGSGALNAYFRWLGGITYTTAPDNTAPRLLTTTVSDGTTASVVISRIAITPVDDRPTLTPAATLRGIAGQPVVITHAMLARSVGAGDADGDPLRFRIASLQAGQIEKFVNGRWVQVSIGGRPLTPRMPFVLPFLSPGERIRWVPPPRATGTVPALTILVSDGKLWALNPSRVSIALDPRP